MDPSIGRAEVFQRSLAMTDSSNPPEFSHPLILALFALAGGGDAGR